MVLEAVRQLAAEPCREEGVRAHPHSFFSLCHCWSNNTPNIHSLTWRSNNLFPVTLTFPSEEILSCVSPAEKEGSVRLTNLVSGAPGSLSTPNNVQIFFSQRNAVNKPSAPGVSTCLEGKLTTSPDTIKVMVSLLSNHVYLLCIYTNIHWMTCFTEEVSLRPIVTHRYQVKYWAF